MSGAYAIRVQQRAAATFDGGALWIDLAGVEAALRPSGALWLADASMLVVADLHLEKGSAYAARGQLLPPYDTAETLSRLEVEAAALRPRTLVLLGDSFHDARAAARLDGENARRIVDLGRGRTLVWVVGNHDADGLALTRARLGGEVADAVAHGPLRLRHEPAGGPAPGEVAGHLHPCAKLVRAGRGVRRRAFLTDGERLILPAFGAYAGGLNVRDPAFAGLFERPPIAAALGERRVHPLPFGALSPD